MEHEHRWMFEQIDPNIDYHLIYRCTKCDQTVSVNSRIPAPPKETK